MTEIDYFYQDLAKFNYENIQQYKAELKLMNTIKFKYIYTNHEISDIAQHIIELIQIKIKTYENVRNKTPKNVIRWN